MRPIRPRLTGQRVTGRRTTGPRITGPRASGPRGTAASGPAGVWALGAHGRVLARALLGRFERRDERGAVLVFVALAMVMILASTALSVDLGRVQAENRRLQAIADMVALDAAQLIDGRPAASIYPAVQAAAMKAAAANHFPTTAGNSLDVVLGIYTKDASGYGHFAPLSPTDATSIPNAVQVKPSDSISFIFQVGNDSLSRVAAAARTLSPPVNTTTSCTSVTDCSTTTTQPPSTACTSSSACPAPGSVAGFTIGSYLLGWDSSGIEANVQDAVLAAEGLLPPLPPLPVPLPGQPAPLPQASTREVGYQGLSYTTLTLGDLVAADQTLGTVSQLLTGNVSVAQLLRAEAAALNNEGSSAVTVSVDTSSVQDPTGQLQAAVSLLQSLASSVPSSETVRLCDDLAAAEPPGGISWGTSTTVPSSTTTIGASASSTGCQLDANAAGNTLTSGYGAIADAEVNGLSLLQDIGLVAGGSGAVANGSHLVDLSSVFPGVSASMYLISPAVVVPPGPVGTTSATTMQLSVTLHVNTPLALSSGTLGTVAIPAQATMPFQMSGASAYGQLSTIDCQAVGLNQPTDTATVAAWTNATNIAGGPVTVTAAGSTQQVGTQVTSDVPGVNDQTTPPLNVGQTATVGQTNPSIGGTLTGLVSQALTTAASTVNVGGLAIPTQTIETDLAAAVEPVDSELNAAFSAMGFTVAGADLTINSISCGSIALITNLP